MRKLVLFLFMVLLGINGRLLWQNREEKKGSIHTCHTVSGPVHIGVKKIKTSLLPAMLGLIL